MSDTHFSIKAIATIRTPFRKRFGTPRQPGVTPSATGVISFHKGYESVDLVRGLEDFSHIWLTFIFDRVRDQGWRPLVRPPRMGGNAKVGVLASRSPYRPNHLGLSLVKLESVVVEGGKAKVTVSGVDLTDDTPIVDIRPYLPYAESIPEAEGGWAGEAPKSNEVTINSEVEDAWDEVPEAVQKLVLEILRADPAPAYHTDGKGYAVELEGYHWQWSRVGTTLEIRGIQKLDAS